ncbi:prolyl oligopeptidase family protein [Orientia chuto str. Dubai]|uniref:Prolyl oligopeptidase family protein n=1 Tax=Orientia chuto str. Dubai TaxID=1359168 RepID=A0A0F3MHM6_9RICK|nr:S9 family peptidase [Candidatus Orientia mediorientalis]KJV55268.1 prolyl oligopeptidase family protein [Orientia chuto str. Dubai]
MSTSIVPPIAKKIFHSFTVNNNKIRDDFAWLRDREWPKQVKDKSILSYLESENSYADAYFNQYQLMITEIYKELKSRIRLTDQSPYTKKKDYFYYIRTEAEKAYQIFCRKYGSMDAEEEIILDINDLAKQYSFVSIGSFSVSPDNSYVAYSVNYDGSERYTIKVLDLNTNTHLMDEIPQVIGNIVWHEEICGFFYTKTNKYWRSDKVLFHKLNSDLEYDKLILEEKNALYNLVIQKSNDAKYLFIESSGHDNNEYYFVSTKDASLIPYIIQQRMPKVIYDVEHYNGEFFILTNDINENFRLAVTKVENPSQKYWKTFIAFCEGEYLKSFDISKSCLIITYKVNGLSAIKILNFTNNKIKTLNFDEQVFSAIAYTSNFEEDDIRVEYSSLRQPKIVYQYDLVLDKLNILKKNEIPGSFSSEEYEVERLYANNNNTLIPISLIYKKSKFKRDGSNPVFLYGYGSYGISISPSFNSNIFSLVDRGIIYALAHIRGGDDLGYSWYTQAKFLTKKNTFEDFICCSKHLIENNYTSKGNIIISGGSAGGLLIGAVINTNPELYKAAILHVPFVDVLNTMLDSSLPLTPGEYDEWGDPQKPEYFDYIRSYSPYDNIKAQHYPHIYVSAGLSDLRVGYWEAAKWVAKLRSLKTDSNKLILKMNMNLGHSGPSDRFESLKEQAQDYCFVLSLLNN